MPNLVIDEFRGTDELVCAEVLYDDNTTGYVTGAVFTLAGVSEIAKSVETASDTKYYNNGPKIVISAEGADTITISTDVIDLQTLARITGKGYDTTTGAFMDGVADVKYYALGYKLGLTDGTSRFVWRYKGRFGIPDESSQTINAGTDSNGQSLTYTGIETVHKFTKAGNIPQKALVVDERDGLANLTNFFAQVTTCDTLSTGSTTIATVMNILSNVTNSNVSGTATVGGTYSGTLTATSGYTLDNVTVVMDGEDVTSSSYTSGTGAISISNVTGNIVIVATATAAD